MNAALSTPPRDPISTVLILVAGSIILATVPVARTIVSPAPLHAVASVGR